MPILDPGWRPEVTQAVDLSQEHPTVDRQPLDQVKLDFRSPVASFKAVIAIGSLVAPAFNFIAVCGGAAGLAVVTMYISLQVGSPAWMSPPAALAAMAAALGFGLPFIYRSRVK